jgi:hypothetical protein
MQQRRRRSSLYPVMWIALVVALCVSVAFWGERIGSSIEPVAAPVVANSSPTPLPGTLIVRSDVGPLNSATLCDEVPSSVRVVTVESFTGVLISTVNCSHNSTTVVTSRPSIDGQLFAVTVPGAVRLTHPVAECEFVTNDDGTQVVMSAKTGSLLSEAQAANCTG